MFSKSGISAVGCGCTTVQADFSMTGQKIEDGARDGIKAMPPVPSARAAESRQSTGHIKEGAN